MELHLQICIAGKFMTKDVIDVSSVMKSTQSGTLPILLNVCLPLKVDPYCDPQSDSDPNPPQSPRFMSGGTKYEHAPMISMELGLLLYGLVRLNKYRTIVETGTCYGHSSSWMAGALKDNESKGMLTTFDTEIQTPNPNDLWREVGVLDRINFINSSVWDEVGKVPSEIDLAFVDSDHDYLTIIKEMDIIWPRLVSRGIVIFHDYTLYPQVRNLMAGYGSNLIFPLGRGCLLTQKP